VGQTQKRLVRRDLRPEQRRLREGCGPSGGWDVSAANRPVGGQEKNGPINEAMMPAPFGPMKPASRLEVAELGLKLKAAKDLEAGAIGRNQEPGPGLVGVVRHPVSVGREVVHAVVGRA
jgi:hypothetical protein